MGLMETENKKIVHPIKLNKPKNHYFWGIFASVVTGVMFLGYSLLGSFGDTVIKSKLNQEITGEVIAVEDFVSDFVKPPLSYQLPASKWIPQTFNNCGPAATAMVLQHFGVNISQAETKAVLRTGDDDSNIFMYEISDYLMESHGIKSRIFVNGDAEVVKTLIANGFYVMVENWMFPNEDIGHVIILRGYDDNEGVFIGDDSYIGVGVKYPYRVFDGEQWKPFNRGYMPVYKPEQEGVIKAIVGENWNEQKMYSSAVKTSLNEINKNNSDVYAWFNLGMSYYALGDFQKSVSSFEKSRSLGWPGRMLWYQIEPIMAYNKVGKYNMALELSDIALKNNEAFAEVHLEKAKAYKGLGNYEMARISAERVLQLNAGMNEAKEILRSL
jgi:hypothetical protein